MKKMAAVNTAGDITYTVSPSDDAFYTEGLGIGDLTFYEIPIDCNDIQVIDTWYWDTEWKTRDKKPSILHYWDTVSSQWIIDLPNARTQAWSRIKQLRTEAELSSFTCDGSVYDSNKEQIMGAVQLAILAQMTSQPFSISWTLKDNTSKTLNAAQMIAVGLALGQKISAIYDTGRLLRIQIDAATTNTELDAIVWLS